MIARPWAWRRRTALRYAAAVAPVPTLRNDMETAMSPQQIELVRASFARLENPLIFGQHFYAHLFAARPDVRKLFPADINVQARKLIDMLAVIMGALRDPERLHDEFAALGRRHAGYGVSEEDYDDVGAALLKALRESFGSAFTPELEQAWGAVYGELAEAMIAAQRAASTTASAG